jgi:hypothetical protein
MAKTDRDLFDTLRAGGLRKKTAKSLSDAFSKADGSAPGRASRKAIADLRSVVAELEDRAKGGPAKRSAAAKKAAASRKRAATQRSNAAKKAAKTRARSSSSSSRSSRSRSTARSK